MSVIAQKLSRLITKLIKAHVNGKKYREKTFKERRNSASLTELEKKSPSCSLTADPINQPSHPRVPYYSPPLFSTIANHCSLHYNLSPQVSLLGMRRKLLSMFFRSEAIKCISIAVTRVILGPSIVLIRRHSKEGKDTTDTTQERVNLIVSNCEYTATKATAAHLSVPNKC